MNGTSSRVAAATGAFYVIAIIAGEQLMAADSTVVAQAGYGLAVLGFTAFVVFVAFLHRVLRDAEGPAGWLATLALSAGLLHSAVRFEAQAPRIIGQYRGGALSQELARTLADLNGAAFVVTGLLLGVYCAAAGRVCLAHRIGPRWLAWFGAVSGVLAVPAAVVGMTDPDRYLPLAFLAGLIWTLVLSVVLTVRPVRTSGESVRREPAVSAA
jgi:hypothetical protein